MAAMMRWGIVVLFSALLLWSPRATAQSATIPHQEPECGFALNYPEGWRAQRNQAGYAVMYGPTFVTSGGSTMDAVVFVGEVQDVTAEESGQLAATAAAARYCLDCLRTPQDRLQWIDRLRQGSMAVSYIVFKATLQQFLNRTDIPNLPGFELRYFMIDDGRARNLPEGSSTRARGYVWLREDVLRDLEPRVIDIIRSVRFIRPQRACW